MSFKPIDTPPTVDLSHNPYQVEELYYITPISTLKSIFEKGVPSHTKVPTFKSFVSGVSRNREIKHLDANLNYEKKALNERLVLYFNPRNSVLDKIKHMYTFDRFCILRISPDVMNIPGATITYRNAEDRDAQFSNVEEGLKALDFQAIFNENIPEEPSSGFFNKKKLAGVLIPSGTIPKRYIMGAYVPIKACIIIFRRTFKNKPPFEPTVGMFYSREDLPVFRPPLAISSSSSEISTSTAFSSESNLLGTKRKLGDDTESPSSKRTFQGPFENEQIQTTIPDFFERTQPKDHFLTQEDDLLDSQICAFLSENNLEKWISSKKTT